jgi:hypothetical protein
MGGKLHFRFFSELEFFDVVASFDYHIRLPHGFSCQKLSFSKMFQLGTFLLWTDFSFCTVVTGGTVPLAGNRRYVHGVHSVHVLNAVMLKDR